MSFKDWCVIILAAGKGTRMESDTPKVLHELGGKPMVLRVIDSAKAISNDIILVVGHKKEDVKKVVSAQVEVKFSHQLNQNGTGDAVRCAIKDIDNHSKHIMVLCGDTPLITSHTLQTLANDHEQSRDSVSVLVMEIDNPNGYGRIIRDESDSVAKIVEQADVSESQNLIQLVNSGIYCFKKDFLLKGLKGLDCDNSQGEYYLTDLIEKAACDPLEKAGYHILKNHYEAMGVNSPKELEIAESKLLAKLSIA